MPFKPHPEPSSMHPSPCLDRSVEDQPTGGDSMASACNQSPADLDESRDPGIRGWSWGGFFLTWIWALGNHCWAGLLGLIPWVGFVGVVRADGSTFASRLVWLVLIPGAIVSIWLGCMGRKMAWRSSKWSDVKHFIRVQRSWAIFGILMWVVLILIAVPVLAAGAFLYVLTHGTWRM